MKGPTADPTTKLANRYPLKLPERFIEIAGRKESIMSISVADARPRLKCPQPVRWCCRAGRFRRHGSRKKNSAMKGAKTCQPESG